MQDGVGYQTHHSLLVHSVNQLAPLSDLPHAHRARGGSSGDVLCKVPFAFVAVKGDINTRSSFGPRLSSKLLISPDPANPSEETAGLWASRDTGLGGRLLE